MTDSRCLLASTNEWAQHNSDIGRDSRSRMCDVTYVPEAKSERRTMRYKKKESELNHPHFVAVRLPGERVTVQVALADAPRNPLFDVYVLL